MKTFTAKSSSNHTFHKKHAGIKHTPVVRSVPVSSSSSLVLQRKPLCPCDGGCPRCTPIIQPKLKIGQPNDKYEQEADRVAEQVMMPEPWLSLSVGDSSKITPLIQRQESLEEEEDEDLIQAKTTGDVTPEVTPAISSGIQSLQGGGRPLSGSERSFFEPRFGTDFSYVRVHDDARGAKAARSVNASAFTFRRNVVFGAGEYSLDASSGRRLFAHELTHVVQQGGGADRFSAEKKSGNSMSNSKELSIMSPEFQGVGPSQGHKHFEKKASTKVSPSRKQTLIQRALKFEFQTRNVIWQVNKSGENTKPLGRKLGREGYSEDGSKPTFLSVGRQGYPEIKAGDMIKAKVTETDKTTKEDKTRSFKVDKDKKSQYIETFRVFVDPSGKFTFGEKQVRIEQVGKTIDNSKDKTMKGKYNKDTYEFNYLDGDDKDKELNVHRDPNGNFQFGKIKRMRKAREGNKRNEIPSDIKEGTAIELQSEARGVVEFETPKWFSNWCALRLRIREAVAMTKAISGSTEITDPKLKKTMSKKIPGLIKADKRPSYETYKKLHKIREWPSSKFPTDDLSKTIGSGKLVVEIVDDNWRAKIQPSEGIDITQYGNLLKEHKPESAKRSEEYVDEILKGGGVSKESAPNLYSFLQMIAYYLERGQLWDSTKKKKDGTPVRVWRKGKDGKKGRWKVVKKPAKYAFLLMSRTSFSSIYSEILSMDEKKIFEEMVEENKILDAINSINPKLKLSGKSRFFKHGHGGGRGPTIYSWLKSIIEPTRVKKTDEGKIKTDLLSHPEGGSAAMGRFQVETELYKKDTNLVKFEMRAGPTKAADGDKGSNGWEAYAESIFKNAAKNRNRPGSTRLVYTESKNCKDTFFEHQKQKAEKKKIKKPPVPAKIYDYGVAPKITLELGDEKKVGFEMDFRLMLPSLLKGKLRPFVLLGAGTGGISAGGGLSITAVEDMGLALAGKGTFRTEWFKAVEIGGGLEATWIIDKSQSLRLGLGWDVWQQYSPEKQRTHVLNIFISKQF
ncbi:MAG: DUF4157 domain-containing protein [bacterium]|nr:DUF4157 domain-containing protein [bacterium]